MNVLISLCDPKQTDPRYDVMVFESHRVVLMQIQNKPNEIWIIISFVSNSFLSDSDFAEVFSYTETYLAVSVQTQVCHERKINFLFA